MWVMSLPASLGAVLRNSPNPFFSSPSKVKTNRCHFSAGGANTPCATLFWVTPAPYTCSSVSRRTSADETHGSVTCSPLCQVPFPKKNKTQSAVSDLVPTYTRRQTTLHPACCEPLDNQAGRKAGKTVFCFILSWNGVFLKYVLLVKSGPSRVF